MDRIRTLALSFNDSISANWIINRRMDLTWFIGGALAGYALFFMHAGLGWDMVGIWFLWVILLDSPHFFGTISRTYFDKQEFKQRKKLLTWSLLWFLAGPAMLLLGYALHELGAGFYDLPWKLFLVFFGLWAYWHVVRQHYGFLRLYQKKGGENNIVDQKLDSALLYSGLLLPFVAFAIRHPDAREQLGLSAAIPLYPTLPEAGRFAALFDVDYLTALSWEHWIVALTVATVGTLTVAYLMRQVSKVRNGEKVNGTKALFLLSVVPLHVYVCYSDAVLTASLLAFSAFVTIFHDLQYHALIWFHHRNRYHKPGVDKKQFGLAPKLSESMLMYAACAIGFALVFRLLGCTLNIHPGCTPFLITSDIQLFGSINSDALLKGLLLGFPLHHYFVDQYIWKTSKSKELQRDLKLEKS